MCIYNIYPAEDWVDYYVPPMLIICLTARDGVVHSLSFIYIIHYFDILFTYSFVFVHVISLLFGSYHVFHYV